MRADGVSAAQKQQLRAERDASRDAQAQDGKSRQLKKLEYESQIVDRATRKVRASA